MPVNYFTNEFNSRVLNPCSYRDTPEQRWADALTTDFIAGTDAGRMVIVFDQGASPDSFPTIRIVWVDGDGGDHLKLRQIIDPWPTEVMADFLHQVSENPFASSGVDGMIHMTLAAFQLLVVNYRHNVLRFDLMLEQVMDKTLTMIRINGSPVLLASYEPQWIMKGEAVYVAVWYGNLRIVNIRKGWEISSSGAGAFPPQDSPTTEPPADAAHPVTKVHDDADSRRHFAEAYVALPDDRASRWRPLVQAIIAGDIDPYLLCWYDHESDVYYFGSDSQQYDTVDLDRIYAEWKAKHVS